jgi:hypothetical protein
MPSLLRAQPSRPLDELSRVFVDFLKAAHKSVPPHWAAFLDAFAEAMQNPVTLPPLPPDAAALAEVLRQPPPWSPAVRDGAPRAIQQLLNIPVAAAQPPSTKARQQRAFNTWIATFPEPGPVASYAECYEWGRGQKPKISEKKIWKLRMACPDRRLRKLGPKN